MCQWLMTKFYDQIMRDAEEKGLREWRRELLKDISGDVLELGCGTGANLEFYPHTLNHLTLTEPSKPMQHKLHTKLSQHKLLNSEILNDKAESLSIADASFDVIVCTLVLCSVNHLEKALAQIHRVLRPQGKFIFIEHVAALNNPKRYQWQRRLSFLWRYIAAGCHVTRRTEEAITGAGFKITHITRQSMRGVPAIVRPSIRGVAVKQ